MAHRRLYVFVLLILLAPARARAAETVEGTVTTEGVGAPGASVFIDDREVQTENDGNYPILGAPATPETLVVSAEGVRTATRPIDVPASGTLRRSPVEPSCLWSLLTGSINPCLDRRVWGADTWERN